MDGGARTRRLFHRNGVRRIQLQFTDSLPVVPWPRHFGVDLIGIQFSETKVQHQIVLVALPYSTFYVTGDDFVTDLDPDDRSDPRLIDSLAITDQPDLQPLASELIVVTKNLSGST